jgi:hypothetical protein
MVRLHSCIRPSINKHPGFSGRKANQTFHGIIKLRAIKGNEKSPWRGSHWFANHLEEETKSEKYEE